MSAVDPGAPGVPSDDHELLTTPTPTYRWTRRACAVWLRLVHRLRIEGREHVPESGGCLVVSNHQSFLDIPILAVAIRRHVAFVARESLTRSRFLAWQLRETGAVLIRRGVADRQALKEMLAHLEREDCVAVFPEGTRTRDGSVGEFRAGALFAAKRARVPIVPAAIDGAFRALPSEARVPRPHPIRIRFGPALEGRDPAAMERAREAICALMGHATGDSGAPRQ